jgi:hypothetical protein
MSNDTLQKIANGLENNDLKLLKSSIDELDDALKSDEFMQRAKMSESIFKSAFLPTIAGKEKDTGVTIMKYIEYAGGPYREVDIIDREGNVLYTCPPVYNRSNNDNNKRLPYSQMAATYELKKARMASEADVYMHNVASGINNSVVIEETSSEFIWNKIIDKYYKEDIVNENIEIKTDKSNLIDDTLINYD